LVDDARPEAFKGIAAFRLDWVSILTRFFRTIQRESPKVLIIELQQIQL
jgi:hypothetical protein